jgi:hypothetical protein
VIVISSGVLQKCYNVYSYPHLVQYIAVRNVDLMYLSCAVCSTVRVRMCISQDRYISAHTNIMVVLIWHSGMHMFSVSVHAYHVIKDGNLYLSHLIEKCNPKM